MTAPMRSTAPDERCAPDVPVGYPGGHDRRRKSERRNGSAGCAGYCYKYLTSDLDSLARHARFDVVARAFDGKGWFVNDLWRCQKRPEVD